MFQTNIKDLKTANVVMIHYATGGILFLIICCLMLFNSEAFIGHYFHPKLLAITHITTLGWISMVIIGSLYQLAPVISNSKLYSINLAYYAYGLILTGALSLAIAFWTFNIGLLIQIASVILLFGISLFLLNIYLTVQRSKEKNIESDFIISSVLWFWFTAFLGCLLAFNFRLTFLPKEHLYFLKIHAHIGLVGWFLCLIIGVASKLIPMFLISGKLNDKLLNYSYYLLNIGLLGFIIDSLFFNGLNRSGIYVGFIIVALILFIIYITEAFLKRLKKNLDIGLKHTFLSFLLICIPMILWLMIKTNFIDNPKLILQLSTALGFSIMFGFITLLILGQTFKNLAFISWLKKYQGYTGKSKTPLPKDLYSETIAKTQLYLFLTGYFITLSGIITSKSIFLLAGCFFLVGAAVMYLINVYKIITHKQTFY